MLVKLFRRGFYGRWSGIFWGGFHLLKGISPEMQENGALTREKNTIGTNKMSRAVHRSPADNFSIF